MNIEKKMSKISGITFVLLLTLSALMVTLPSVSAQAPRISPHAYINAVPNPAQVNTVVVLHVGSIYPTPSQVGGWTGLTAEITRPDGSTETLGPISTDTTGGTGVVYIPTQVGSYTIRTHFPETVTTASGYYGVAGTILEDSYSDPMTLVVQTEPTAHYPAQPLPTEYWTRPIDGQFRGWYVIGGNHVDSNMPTGSAPHSIVAPFNDYAPESSHILFRKPLNLLGGLAGGTMGEHGFEQGDSYEGKFSGVVVIGGILCYNEFESNGGTRVENDVIAVDLHTGEQLWKRPLLSSEGNRVSLSFGQVFYWDSYNHHAVYGYLWGTSGSTWHAFEVGSGRWAFSMTDVPSGVNIIGDKGEIYRYYVNKNQGYMRLWNSSRVVSDEGSWLRGNYGRTFNATRGIEWTMNITGLADLPGSAYKYRNSVIIGTDFARGRLSPDPASMWCIGVDLINGPTLLWSRTWDFPGPMQLAIEDVSEADDLFIVSTKETRATYGFRLSTGALVWGPTPTRDFHDVWGQSSGNSWDIIADGKVIAGNYGGTVWCYSAVNGSVLWTCLLYTSPSPRDRS